MRTLLFALFAFVVAGAAMLPDTADAKRLGGGKTLGQQYNMPRQAPPQGQAMNQQAPRQQAAPGQRPQSGASRWLGPLAGLAAGGLLASLFFGDAFEGFQIMDFLLIAALVFGGFMLFRMLRANRGPTPAAAGAGAGAGQFRTSHEPTMPYSGGASAASPAVSGGDSEAPNWFDGAGFVEGAKTHFIRLQAAWDSADFRDIREYTTPQLFAELKREREAMGDAPNYTEVVTLNAELVSVQRDGDRVVASVRFSGLIREEEHDVAKPVDEIWHVVHDWASSEGDWLITGIQQVA